MSPTFSVSHIFVYIIHLLDSTYNTIDSYADDYPPQWYPPFKANSCDLTRPIFASLCAILNPRTYKSFCID